VLTRTIPTLPLTGSLQTTGWTEGRHLTLALGEGIAPLEGEVTMNVLRGDGGRAVRLLLDPVSAETGEAAGELFGNLDPDGSFQGFIRYQNDAGVYRLNRQAGADELVVRRIPVSDLLCSFSSQRPDGMLTPAEAAAPAAPPTVIDTPVVTPGSAVISIGDVRMAEGQTKGNIMQFPVVCGTASGAGTAAISVQWTLVGVTATAGSDFKMASGKLTLGRGKSSGTISVTTIPDRISEGDETFKVVLSNPVNATLGKSEGFGTILDDEWSATITTATPPQLAEPTGDVAKARAAYSVPFTLSMPAQEAVSFSWKLISGTATAGKDFTAASGTVKLAAGQGTFTVPVTILGDATTEPGETFTIEFSKLPAMLTADPVTVTITAAAPVTITPPSEVFTLESKPGAAKVLYLELTGATLTGTVWNKTSAPITTPSVYAQFGDTGIRSIWITVAEGYRAFDVNVTTSKAVFDATPITNRTWCLFTSEPAKFGSNAAGIAYVDVFGQPAFEPALAFTTGNYTIDCYPTIAIHELGHNLGLSHDGEGTNEYDTGETVTHRSWGPWMGAPYYMFYRQFSDGDYPGATQQQDDLALIARYLPVRPDETGSTLATAVDLPLQSGGTTPTVTGIITSRNDTDSYRLVLATATTVTIKLDANQDGAYSLAPGLKIFTAAGADAAPAGGAGWTEGEATLTWAGTLPAGTYRVEVAGIGDPAYYSNYGAIGGYTLQATGP